MQIKYHYIATKIAKIKKSDTILKYWWGCRAFSYCSWGPQGKNTEVVCHSLLRWTKFCQNSPPWPVLLETLFFCALKSLQMVTAHETKRCLLLGRKAMTNLDSILKSRDITLPTKVGLVKVIVFPVVRYGYESWTIKKAERQRTDAFELWCWRRLLRVPWTARRYNQSIPKEISPGCSLEGLMLKLRLQYFGCLMQRSDSFERSWCWERLKTGGEGDNRGWDGWMASPIQWTWVWASSGS